MSCILLSSGNPGSWFPLFRAASDLLDLSSTSRATSQSDDDLEQLQRDVLGFLPADEESQDADPADVGLPVDHDDSGSLDSSGRVEPSGTTTLEEPFQPQDSSSPRKTQASDSEDDDLGNGSLFSIGDLIPDVVVVPPAHQGKAQQSVKSKTSPNVDPSVGDQLANAMSAAGIPVAQSTQAPPSLPSAVSVSLDPTSIPADLEGLVSLQPSSSAFVEEKVDWRVAEEPLIRACEDNDGRFWMLMGGPGGQSFRCKKGLFTEKPVSGKTLIALTSTGLQWPLLVSAFRRLKQPSEPGLMEPEQRKMRRSMISSFLSQESSFPKALGEWELGEDGKSVVVGKLPLLMQEVLDQKRQARPSSPPYSFEFKGKADSELEEVLSSWYTPDKDLKTYLEWGDYLTADRLPEPDSSATLETIRKDLAQVARPLQCSLAAADIALHLGTLGPESSPSQADLRSLIQVMGVLCTESALSLLPRFDRQSQLYSTEKRALREKVLKGIKPPSTSIALQKAPVFSPGLFPEKVFREVDVKAREVDSQSYFPKFQARQRPPSAPMVQQQQATSFKRPLALPAQTDNTRRKRTKPSLPGHQGGESGSWRRDQPSTSKAPFQGGFRHGQQFHSSGAGRGKSNKLPARRSDPPNRIPAPQGGKATQPSNSSKDSRRQTNRK